MGAGKYNMKVEKGAVFPREIRFIGHDGAPIDLTGYFATMMARDLSGNLLFTLSEENGGIRISPYDRTKGKMELFLSAVNTGNLVYEGSAKYDLELRNFSVPIDGYNGMTPVIHAGGTGTATFSIPFGFDYDAPSGTLTHAHYVVTIEAGGATFAYTRDGAPIASGVVITGEQQTLDHGVYVLFAATSGYTVGEAWTFSVSSIICDVVDSGWLSLGSLKTYDHRDCFTNLRPATVPVFSGVLNDLLQPGRCSVPWPYSATVRVKAILGPSTVVHTGSSTVGIDLCARRAPSTAASTLEIDMQSTNTFIWRVNGGAWSGAVTLPTPAYTWTALGASGLSVAFPLTTGYNANDYWTIELPAVDRFQWSDDGVIWRNAAGDDHTTYAYKAGASTAMTSGAYANAVTLQKLLDWGFGSTMTLYTDVLWNAVNGHDDGVVGADLWTFTIQQKLVMLSYSSSELNRGVYAVCRVTAAIDAAPVVAGEQVWFSRIMDGGDNAYDNAIVLREMTVGGHYAFRLLEGVMTILAQQTRSIYPI